MRVRHWATEIQATTIAFAVPVASPLANAQGARTQLACTITGTNGDDVLNGTPGPDVTPLVLRRIDPTHSSDEGGL